MSIEFKPTKLEGVWEITPQVFGDERGFFCEAWKKREFETATGINPQWVQQNLSQSPHFVLRGLHYQTGEHAQAKLVQVISGSVIDVAVDLRQSSPTFGQSVAVELNDVNRKQLFIPRGFAHGFLVMSEKAIFNYLIDNFYAPEFEAGINWADKSLGIDWHFDEFDKKTPLLNARDQKWPFLTEVDSKKLF